jgi:hypothetical protein
LFVQAEHKHEKLQRQFVLLHPNGRQTDRHGSKKPHAACPFCGSTRTFSRLTYDPDGKWHVVVCEQCCAEGPRAETAARSWRLWNGQPISQDREKRRRSSLGCPFCKRKTEHWIQATCFPSARRSARTSRKTATSSRSKT